MNGGYKLEIKLEKILEKNKTVKLENKKEEKLIFDAQIFYLLSKETSSDTLLDSP